MAAVKKNYLPQMYAPFLSGTTKYDLSKRWFVYVTKRTPTGNQRFKYYVDGKKFPTVDERLMECERLIDEKTKSIDIENLRHSSHPLVVVLERHTRDQKPKGKATYTTKVNFFLKWSKYLAPENISQKHVQKFIDELKDRKLSHTTINSYKVILKSLFEDLHLKKNPFAGIKKLRETKRSLMWFDKTDSENVKKYLIKNDPQQWLAVQFIYYCFIRPGELRQLKWENVNFNTKQLHIPHSINKNGKNQSVHIPEPFYKFLIKNKYHVKARFEYLIGKNGNSEMCSRDAISKKHRKHLNNLGFSNIHSLYSWKHTGVFNVMSGNDINIKELQLQLRHSSLKQTDEYLKNFRINDCVNIQSKFPSI